MSIHILIGVAIVAGVGMTAALASIASTLFAIHGRLVEISSALHYRPGGIERVTFTEPPE